MASRPGNPEFKNNNEGSDETAQKCKQDFS